MADFEGTRTVEESKSQRICARLGCVEVGKMKCSACLCDYYCSKECQRLDWTKTHKEICKILKFIPKADTVVTKHSINVLFNAAMAYATGGRNVGGEDTSPPQVTEGATTDSRRIRCMEHVATFGELQYWQENPSLFDWELTEKIANILGLLGVCYQEISRYFDPTVAPKQGIYYGKSLAVLKKYQAKNKTEQNEVNSSLAHSSINLSRYFRERGVQRDDLEKAEQYHQLASTYESKMNPRDDELMMIILNVGIELSRRTGRFIQAKNNAIEICAFLTQRHGPLHAVVQQANTRLVDAISDAGDLEDAQRLARANYGLICDLPIEGPSALMIAHAAHQVADTTFDVITRCSTITSSSALYETERLDAERYAKKARDLRTKALEGGVYHTDPFATNYDQRNMLTSQVHKIHRN